MKIEQANRQGRNRPDSRAVKGLVAAVLSVLMLLVAVPSGATPIDAEGTAAATSGATWLKSQLALGIPLQVFGSGSWGATLEAATALAAVDSTDPDIAKVWDSLVANREAALTDGSGIDLPGRLAQAILLAHSTGMDPRAVGTGPGSDLVQRLKDTLTPSGLFGTQASDYDGVYRQGQSIAALAAVGETPDASAVQWLLDQQCVGPFEGAWMAYRADTSVDCFSDPAAWTGPDSNGTALAVSALSSSPTSDAAVGASISSALTYLAGAQLPDGGWGINPFSESDPNSTAVVLQALIATDSLSGPGFNDKSTTPLRALLSFQLGSDFPVGDRGAFTYPGTDNSPSELSTVQAVAAAAGRPLIFVANPAVEPEPHVTTNPPVTTQPVEPSDPGPTSPATQDPSAGPGAATVMVAGQAAARRISFAG